MSEIEIFLSKCDKKITPKDIKHFRQNWQEIVDHYLTVITQHPGFYGLISDSANFPQPEDYDWLMTNETFLEKVLREDDFDITLEYLCRVNPSKEKLLYALNETLSQVNEKSTRWFLLQAMRIECQDCK